MELISLNIQPHVATLLFETSRFGNGLSWLQMKDHFKTQNEKRAGFHSRTSRKEIPSAFSILLLLSLHQYHQYQWRCGSYFKVLKEALVQVPSAFSAHHPEGSTESPGPGAAHSSCGNVTFALQTEASRAPFSGAAACALLRNRYSPWPRDPPIFNLIYMLLNCFMNPAPRFMPGILPCAVSSLYKPLGLALICFPRVPRSENLDTRKKERGRKQSRAIKAQSEITSEDRSEHGSEGWSGSSAQVLGSPGAVFPLRLRKRGSCWLARRCTDICASLAGFLVLFRLVAAGWEHAALSCSRFENALLSAPDYCQAEI